METRLMGEARTRFPSFFSGTQSTSDTQGGTKQQHSWTNQGKIPVFLDKNFQLSWLTEGMGQTLQIGAGTPEVDR